MNFIMYQPHQTSIHNFPSHFNIVVHPRFQHIRQYKTHTEHRHIPSQTILTYLLTIVKVRYFFHNSPKIHNRYYMEETRQEKDKKRESMIT
jgi:hypothetical protein